MFASTKLALLLVLGSLFSALFLVDGHRRRIMSPDQMKQSMLEAIAEHFGGDMDRASRELAATHDEYDTVCEDFGYGLANMTSAYSGTLTYTDYTTDNLFDCLCNCEGFDLDFSYRTSRPDISTMYCAYQSFSEAITTCYSSDALEDCEDACSSGDGSSILDAYDCMWSYQHKRLTGFFGWCNDSYTSDSWWLDGPSSLDTTDSSSCIYYEDNSYDDTGNYFVTEDYCEWYSGAAPTAGRMLIAAMVVANGLLMVATFMATTLL
ncbi:unnamed protein product [Heterosigma akashiwo]|mmetsp:Transcript_4130/g.5813  ORF Transcript_4130/g.5813 Transcript_4130/m.5813 type:complete len:264 (-) Transcript_4130:262-1053(-)